MSQPAPVSLFGRYARNPLRWAVVVASAALWGCGGGGQASSGHAPANPSLKEEGSRVFGTAPPAETAPAPRTGRNDASPAAAPANWTIAIAAFRSRNDNPEAAASETLAAANVALARTRTEGGLPDAYVQRRGAASVIVYGRYTGPDDPRAKADLERIQTMQIGGMTPYALAFLSPPVDTHAPTSDYDLRLARKLYGPSAVYTLQVGWYGREELRRPTEADLAEARKAAEKAAATLRAEGELAFFYHGPTRSLVTVGIFDASDFRAGSISNDGSVSLNPMEPAQQSQRLLDARQRHPLNLYNGAGFKVKTKTMHEGALAKSVLVMIPKQ